MESLTQFDLNDISCFIGILFVILPLIAMVAVASRIIIKMLSAGIPKEFAIPFFLMFSELFHFARKSIKWLPDLGIVDTLSNLDGCEWIALILIVMYHTLKTIGRLLVLRKFLFALFTFRWGEAMQVLIGYAIIDFIALASSDYLSSLVRNNFQFQEKSRPIFECFCGVLS